MITYDYYRIFYFVARYKSFTKAAKMLGNNQPNITRCMNILEQELKCTLFLRSNRGISLTPEGKKLYEHVAIAYEQLQIGEEEIRQIHEACDGKILKVIIETCLLTEEEKIKMCEIVTRAGADYIKTSTGFGTGGATKEDVELFKKYIGPKVKIKAAGGVSSMEDLEMFLELGCDRIGTSRAVGLCKGELTEGY